MASTALVKLCYKSCAGAGAKASETLVGAAHLTKHQESVGFIFQRSHRYSIIETAKANDRDPFAYLKHLLTQLPLYQKEGKDLEDLMPWNVELG